MPGKRGRKKQPVRKFSHSFRLSDEAQAKMLKLGKVRSHTKTQVVEAAILEAYEKHVANNPIAIEEEVNDIIDNTVLQ